ncbi:MAG: DUF932 domain-containing protein [Verrucomicrobia bacterium]|nr:DUF932 domain-containing protein [Verrucomicrobiota bacterium]
MPRITRLNEIMFPVEEHPVFARISEDGFDHDLVIPSKKAIINGRTRKVIGVVGQNYRTVSNTEALDMATRCCATVFPETKPGEWQAATVDGPSTAGYCQIDLRHNTAALNFNCVPAANRPEVFGPFIRVTNSFNTSRALNFAIGFYRKVCKNGMILPQEIIRFSFVHSRRALNSEIMFTVDKFELEKYKGLFTQSMAVLNSCTVLPQHFDLLMRAGLSIQPPANLTDSPRIASDWGKLGAHITEVNTRYAGELGENAYAVFNAITDIASHPPTENCCVRRDRHSFQSLAGSWLASFTTACSAPSFSIENALVI